MKYCRDCKYIDKRPGHEPRCLRFAKEALVNEATAIPVFVTPDPRARCFTAFGYRPYAEKQCNLNEDAPPPLVKWAQGMAFAFCGDWGMVVVIPPTIKDRNDILGERGVVCWGVRDSDQFRGAWGNT